ncbi:MAG: hypothetical protein QF464_22565, partial [Myxococcota bacterium]|nr:hypothetical protein [Myxococcota bacterium]
LGTPATYVVTAAVTVDEDDEVIATHEASPVDALCDDAGYRKVTLSLPVITEKAEFQLIAAPATVTLEVAFETTGGDSTQITVVHKGELVL